MSSHIIKNIGHIFWSHSIMILCCFTRFTPKNNTYLVGCTFLDIFQLSLFTTIANLACQVLVYVNECSICYACRCLFCCFCYSFLQGRKFAFITWIKVSRIKSNDCSVEINFYISWRDWNMIINIWFLSTNRTSRIVFNTIGE